MEYGGCFREDELGKLRDKVKDRNPSTVKVRVSAYRVTEQCVTDGFYRECFTRRQPYALVVSGPLLARDSDGSLVPPVFSSYRAGSAPPKDLDDAPIAPGPPPPQAGGAASVRLSPVRRLSRLAVGGWSLSAFNGGGR